MPKQQFSVYLIIVFTELFFHWLIPKVEVGMVFGGIHIVQNSMENLQLGNEQIYRYIQFEVLFMLTCLNNILQFLKAVKIIFFKMKTFDSFFLLKI